MNLLSISRIYYEFTVNMNATHYLCLGFECECNAGYSGNGMTCDDVDECLASPCSETAECQNSLGSYSCACPAGFDPTPGTSGND